MNTLSYGAERFGLECFFHTCNQYFRDFLFEKLICYLYRFFSCNIIHQVFLDHLLVLDISHMTNLLNFSGKLKSRC